jgi:membrane protein implicated in regulation of membrane protease activity
MAMLPAAPTFWLILGGALLVLELVGLDTDGLITIGGVVALVLAAIVSLLPLPPLLQGILFAVLVGLGYAGLRRWSLRQGQRGIPPAAGADLAEVIEPFDAEGQGRVRWQGQSWAAHNLTPERALPPGSRVMVMGREGTRLQVMPR